MRAPDSSASTRTVWVGLGRRSGALPGAGLRLNTGGGEAARASANCGFAGKHSIHTILPYDHNRFGGRRTEALSRCFLNIDSRLLSAKPERLRFRQAITALKCNMASFIVLSLRSPSTPSASCRSAAICRLATSDPP
jgi:hypothetical protein